MEHWFFLIFFPFLGSVAGTWLTAYVKKRAENYATHADIDKLVDQVRAVTHTTKSIEARISDDVWQRQKGWEIKKEAVFEAVREMCSAASRLRPICSYHFGVQGLSEGAKEYPELRARFAETHADYRNALEAFERAKGLVSIVCSPEACGAFDKTEEIITTIAVKAIQLDTQALSPLFNELLTRQFSLSAILRRELYVAKTDAATQSTR